MGVDIPVDCSFQSYQISTTLRADVPVAATATKNLEGTMLPINYGVENVAFRTYQSCQQLELTFLPTIALRATSPVNSWS